jgi:N-acetylglucosaminyldiphosphoundecaprenol N-acetyl-beta-D-mannosaminyltransferase
MDIIDCMGYRVFSGKLSEINFDNTNRLLNTISPNSYGISTKDDLFSSALKASDYLVLDGVYFALASILLKRKNIIRNQGPDVFRHFMVRMNEAKGRIFFLGSTNATLEKIKNKARFDYPEIKIEFFSPPFKNEFSEEDNNVIFNRINEFKPDILFVGMTCPKQEKWAYLNKNRINARLTCCLGAVFDWYAGNEKTIAPFWWKLRLAWLIRTINRPEILKRYPNIGIFFWHLFLAFFRLRSY